MAYNGKLGHRRHEGWEPEYHAASASVAIALSDAKRSRLVDMTPAREPHRPIQGAHLRHLSVVTLKEQGA